MEIRIKLDNFEGPLDLLLHLIDKRELDINKISISQVIDEYLILIEENGFNSLNNKIEFLQVAAELLEIKAFSILKKDEKSEKEEDIQNRIIEYKKYKQISEELKLLEDEDRIAYSKDGSEIKVEENNEIDLSNIDINLIFKAYKNAIVEEEIPYIKIDVETPFTIANGIEKLKSILSKNREMNYLDLFNQITQKNEKIAVFLAVLELYKMSQISLNEKSVSYRK